ncbi:MAG: hypothetical protein WCE63_07615 [Acidobacteriaceae bacterium]
MEIEISKSALRQSTLNLPEDATASNDDPQDLIEIEVAAELKRCGGEMRLVLPPDSPGASPTQFPL